MTPSGLPLGVVLCDPRKLSFLMPRFWTVLLFLILRPLAAQAIENPYWQELVHEAHEKKLAQRLEWRNLLHYKPYPFWPGSRSLADDPRFFNALDGKTNSESELEATLASFFSDLEETQDQQNPQCAFIARYHWLKQELHFDPRRLPEQPCQRFYNWRTALNPGSITLVFPAAYLNNPASMYGHTLLRVDAKGRDKNERLLSYSISYAAATLEINGLVFAMKGLFGGYPGMFSIIPYYLKVREYSDIDNRDVWEYELNLTEEEIDRILMHVWELRPIRFDYFFFDENCAYHLLSFLDVARPELGLTDQFRWWAIPSDTVRAVTEQPGLLREVVYRPASITVMRQRMREMDEQQRGLARDIAEQRVTLTDTRLRQLPVKDQAAVLELSDAYLSYQRTKEKQNVNETSQLEYGILLARNALAVPSQAPTVTVPQIRPDEGHRSSRVGIGGGHGDGRGFWELQLRPTYHDLLDDDGGYTQNAQIQFFNLTVRNYQGEGRARVENFVPLDIVSLSPRDDYFKSLSWKISAGWWRKRFPNGDEPMVFRLNGGPGFAWDLSDSFRATPVIYGILEGALDVSNRFSSSYAIGLGPNLGVLADLTGSWRVNLFARSLRYGLGDEHDVRELVLEQRITLDRQHALRVSLERKQEFDHYADSTGIVWQAYF